MTLKEMMPFKTEKEFRIAKTDGTLKEDIEKLEREVLDQEIREGEIDWDCSKEVIQPSIHFTEKKCYVGAFLPTMNGREEFFIISSDKEKWHIPKLLFRTAKNSIEERKITTLRKQLPFYIRSIPTNIGQRWSLKSIQGWMNDTAPKVSVRDAFEKFKAIRMKYLDYPAPYYYDVLALWDLGTYFCQIFQTYPEIFFQAVRESGKTKSLQISEGLGFNGMLIISLRNSPLFRISQDNRATTLVDEIKRKYEGMDTDVDDALRGKYKKGAKVLRTEKTGQGAFQVNSYDLFSPLAMANIRGIQPDQEQRAIIFSLIPTMTKKGNLTPNTASKEFQDARDTAYLCLMQNWSEIAQKYSEILLKATEDNMSFRLFIKKEVSAIDFKRMGEYMSTSLQESSVFSEISNRELELWGPLFILASEISTEFTEDLLWVSKIVAFSSQKEGKNESKEAKLVSTLLKTVASLKASVSKESLELKLSTSNIKIAFQKDWFPDYDPNTEEKNWLNNQFIGNCMNTIDKTGRIFRRIRSGARGSVEYEFNEIELLKYAIALGINDSEPEKKELPKDNPVVEGEIDASQHSGKED